MANNLESISSRLAREAAQGRLDISGSPAPPAIPAAPSGDLLALHRTVAAVKSILDMREGWSGSVMDKHLTLRDLMGEGALVVKIGANSYQGNSTGALVVGSYYKDPRPVLLKPPTLTGLTVRGAFKTIQLNWNMLPYANHAYVEVWRAAGGAALGTAVLNGTTTADLYIDSSGVIGATYQYWVRAVAKEGAVGDFDTVPGVLGGLLLIGNVNMGPLAVDAANLASGAVTATKIAALAIDATKFAASVEPITIVAGSTIPTTKSTISIWLVGTEKLYKWVSGAYTASVNTSDLSGQVTTAQIVDDAITSLKIAAGQVTAAKTSLAAINAATGDLNANTVNAAQIVAGQVIAGKLATDSVVAANILAGAITTVKMTAGTINASVLVAGSITTGMMTADSINGDRITANTLTAGKIVAGSITATQIAAGAISTSKLLVTGQGAALNDDPYTQDIDAWTPASASLTSVADSTSPAGRYVLRSTAYNAFMSRPISVDVLRNYQFRIWAQQESGTSICYLTVYFFDAALNPVYIASGWPSNGSYNYFGVVGTALPGAWTEYAISFGPNSPAGIPAGAKYCHVGVLSNYSGSGAQRFAGIRLMERASYDMIVDGAIIATKLAAGSVVAGKLAANAIVAADGVIGNLAVDSAQIAALAIGTAKIADGAITNLKVSGGIDAGKISVGTLSAGVIGANSIDATKINTNNLTIKDASGNVILGSGASINPSSYMSVPGGWLNSNIAISAGAISGIGTGAGTVVDNSLVTAAAIGAVKTDASNAPSTILNSSITAVTLGAVKTDASNAPSTILNSSVALSAGGVLSGGGGGAVTVAGLDNTIVRGGFPITSGNISTYISAAAVGLAHINVASIGALSALTANLGTITAGTISGVTGTFSGTLTAQGVITSFLIAPNQVVVRRYAQRTNSASLNFGGDADYLVYHQVTLAQVASMTLDTTSPSDVYISFVYKASITTYAGAPGTSTARVRLMRGSTTLWTSESNVSNGTFKTDVSGGIYLDQGVSGTAIYTLVVEGINNYFDGGLGFESFHTVSANSATLIAIAYQR